MTPEERIEAFWFGERPDQIRNIVLESAEQGSPDSRRFAFEVSELIPPNWKESMPVVIEAIMETRRN